MGKHRRTGTTTKKLAALGAAAIATTALTAAVVPDPQADQQREELLRLLADSDFRPFGTDPQAIPDLTGGLGSQGYSLSQDVLGQLVEPSADDDETAGFNLITTGPIFGLLSLFGVDYGRVPPLPNSIADEINGTSYLDPSFAGIESYLKPSEVAALKIALRPILRAAGVPESQITATINALLGPVTDIADVRLIPVVGVGLGAFAAGAAYQQVVDDLPNQPGGEDYTGTQPQGKLGSFTILPMVLVFNPGRANGGPLARAYPLFRLFGIDTVTPETVVSSSSDGGFELGDTGLTLGGANLIPIKLDIGVQNFPASDFAAWPNPVTLANNGAALLFPTYIIRGADLSNIEGAVEDQIEDQLPDALDSRPLAFNFYVTIPVSGAPVLEPTYLAVDALNLITGGSFNNPIGTALNPALESAGNLGYTDVERQLVDGEYQYVRTFDDTGTPTAFFSFPDVDWEKVPGDLVNLVGVGLRQAIDDGLTGNTSPNALKELLNLLGIDNSSSSSSSSLDLSTLSGGLVGNALGSVVGSQTENVQDADFQPTAVNSPATGSGQTQTVQVPQGSRNESAPTTGNDLGETTRSTKRPVAEILDKLGNSVARPRTTAATGANANQPTELGDAVKKASDGVKKTVDSVSNGLQKAVGDVQRAVTDTAKKMSEAAKPKKEADGN